MVEDSLRGNIFTIDNKKKTKKSVFHVAFPNPFATYVQKRIQMKTI